MTIKELEKLFKLCRRYKLSEFKSESIHAIFEDPSPDLKKPSQAVRRQIRKTAETAKLQSEYDDVQEELESMHIENPMAYEDALVKGLLTSEEDGHREA